MWILANALVIWSITHGVHSQHHPCPPTWQDALLEAATRMLDAAKSQYVILFSDVTLLSENFLPHAHGSGARLLLMGCNGSIPKIMRFLTTVKGRCFSYCSFICLCQDPKNVDTILDAAENMNLIRPWTLWFFISEDVLPLMISRKLGATGVPIAIPFQNNRTEKTGCSTAEKSIRVMSLLGNSASEKIVFHYDTITDSHGESIFLAGQSDGKYRILNMQNVTVAAAGGEFPPFISFNKSGKSVVEGICIEMLNTFKSSMNFSYTLVQEQFTGIVRNGSWSGLIGNIANKTYDIGLGGITVTSERAQVVDFTNPFMEDQSGILSPAPGPRNNIFMFVRIFQWEVWIVLLVTIILMGPTLALIENYPRADIVTLSWLVVANVLQQGDLKPEKNASRILASFWLFFLVVFMGTYSGLMLAIMSFPGTEAPIETLEQLANSYDVTPTIFSQSSTRMYIDNRTSPASMKLSKVWASTNDIVVRSLDNASVKLSTGRYAFIGEKVNFREIIFRKLNECNCCPYYESHQDFLKHQYSLALGKNSPLMGSFNNILRQLREKGLIAHWISKYQRNIEQCSDTQKKSSDYTRPLRLQDLLGALVTLSLGLGAALICLIIEHCVAEHNKRQPKRPTQPMK